MTEQVLQENTGEQEGSDGAVPKNIDASNQRSSVFSKINSSDEDVDAAPLWLITFADIMALMLTFFVMLYTMSVPEVKKWEEVVSSVNEGFSKFYSPENNAGPQDSISIDKISPSKGLSLKYLQSLLKVKVDKNEILQGTIVEFHGNRKLIISLPNNLLFDSGGGELNENGRRAIYIIGDVLNRIRNRVEVVGHTDPRPFQAGLGAQSNWNSNWELSMARAWAAAATLREVGYLKDLSVYGVSSARYDELSDSLDEETRLGLSRRVDIIIMQDDGDRRSFLDFQAK